MFLRLEHFADEEPLQIPVLVRDAALHDAVDLELVNTSLRASSSTGRSKSTYSRSHETGTFISELLQHADVVLPEQPEVVEAMAQHRDALDPSPNAKPGHTSGS